MSRTIFISYSRKDASWLDRLLPFLKPFERNGVVLACSDRLIQGGEVFDERIANAIEDAVAVILLISENFLASDYIQEKELPPILARLEKEKMPVLPVFLSPSPIQKLPIQHIAKLNGYGSPDKPLVGMSEVEWKNQFNMLAERVSGLVAKIIQLALPSKSSPSPSHHVELWCRMDRRGEELQTGFSLRRDGESVFTLTRTWKQVAISMDKINKMVKRGKTLFGDWPHDEFWGNELFSLLFGAAEDNHKVLFNKLFTPLKATAPTPVFAPVKLYITTEIAELLTLPWRLTRWQAHLLSEAGWLFLPGDGAMPFAPVQLHPPFNVLVLTADGNSLHVQSLQEILVQAWGAPKINDPWFRVVTRGDEVEMALSGMLPQLIYCHGKVEDQSLQMQDGPLELASLANWLKMPGMTVKLLCFNTHGPLSPINQLYQNIPLLVQRPSEEENRDADTVFSHWFARWLQQEMDPLLALNVPIGNPEEETVVAIQRYSSWTSIQTAPLRRHISVKLNLDRDTPKALIRKWLGELVNHGSFKLMAMVPHAEEGNHLPDFSSQVQHDLEINMGELILLKPVRVAFPSIINSQDDFTTALRETGQHAANTPLGHILRSFAPRTLDHRKPVLWLDWGCHGLESGCSPPLAGKKLTQWLEYCALMAETTPQNLRIMTTLAIQANDEKAFSFIDATLEKARRNLNIASFWIRFIPALERVPFHELDDLLKNPHYGCPFGLYPNISRLIMKKTKGHYQEVVNLLQEGVDFGWLALLDKLNRAMGVDFPEEEITLK
ncbi:MAG: toll/interleukin-1 receptor domain-containing protein [Magnetococcales bacterium]|nr:toll/interleukin-1 receptor domain-containing protein [Magnetococcales bacterium]NGZ28399.1 toll/interleukin-1 receptor domain-containing protein [Magnetococcales bacterium]